MVFCVLILVSSLALVFLFFFFIVRRPPSSIRTDTLFPSPTRSRSEFGRRLALQRLPVEDGPAAGDVDHHLANEGVGLEVGPVGGNAVALEEVDLDGEDRKSTRLNSSH